MLLVALLNTESRLLPRRLCEPSSAGLREFRIVNKVVDDALLAATLDMILLRPFMLRLLGDNVDARVGSDSHHECVNMTA